MTSNINVDQPRISNKHTTVIPRTREPVGTQTRQRKREWQKTITLIKRALKAEESQTEWLSSHSVAIQQADERMSRCSQTKFTEHDVKHQRWPTKDLELTYQCKTKNTETGKNTICQMKENRQSFNEINKWAQKWIEKQTEWASCQCCDPAGRWAHVKLQSNENYRTWRQTSTLTNQGFRTNTPLWYQEHGNL